MKLDQTFSHFDRYLYVDTWLTPEDEGTDSLTTRQK